ncbi:hypothetical protein [Alicyclobacillus dauci]|uniref:Uncharacterized protein n=1 Tax=Alicyclobacillus dauci TaxID=1475485 RepID=A0ABY6Z998_9BACL|nr:hypothetical protein [Alicyclobacillus dauci]WAH38660.1 hypothetical protein NZD86_09340 [Alicyclobacillus dauci]
MMFGEYVVDFTVDTEKFLFHACFQGEQGVTFKKYSQDGKSKWYIQRLKSCSPYIPYGLSRAKYWRVLTAFALKGTCKNLYGGISLRLVSTRIPWIRLLNSISNRFGYDMVKADEYNSLRTVTDMINSQNKALERDVAMLTEKVKSHEALLGQFCIQNQSRIEEISDIRSELSTLKEQMYVVCVALGIQSVDEFLNSALPMQLKLLDDDGDGSKKQANPVEFTIC